MMDRAASLTHGRHIQCNGYVESANFRGLDDVDVLNLLFGVQRRIPVPRQLCFL